MTYEFWVEAENFLHVSFFINLLILGIMIIMITSRLSFIGCKHGKTSNIFWSVVCMIFLMLSINTTLKFNKYKKLYDYDKYVNYGIRNNKRIIFVYETPNHVQRRFYKGLYLVDNFRGASIYDEEKINQDVEFLGRDGNKFYFQDGDYISYRELGDHLGIVDDISKPIREGVKFKLKDSRFKDIGFKEESTKPYLLNYKIPKSMENKRFENPKNIKVSEQEGFTLGWINPTISTQLRLSKEK